MDARIRDQFPFLSVNPTPIYFDNAATTQLPNRVIDAIAEHYRLHNANVGRSNHRLAREATERYEQARNAVARFINAASEKEVIFTANASDSLNLTAYVLEQKVLVQGDTILLTHMEHHSNMLPWLDLAKRVGAFVEYIPLTLDGELDLDHIIENPNGSRIKVLAMTHTSNVLGTVNNIAQTVQTLRKLYPNMVVVVDGAQAVGHTQIDVQALGCDFFSFSAHKMYGPQGVGVLWGRFDLLKEAQPPVVGGGTISDVTWHEYTLAEAPHRFEAGTPNVAGAVGLEEAIKFIKEIGFDAIHKHEQTLRLYLIQNLMEANINGLTLFGLPNKSESAKPKDHQRTGLVSLSIEGVDPHDLATFLDEDNIMTRSGTHCAIPLQRDILQVGTTLRISFAVYNTIEEINQCVTSITNAVSMLR